jgi:DNA modification methylase
MILGDSLDWLHAKSAEKSVDLIVTSPPFGLVRKKVTETKMPTITATGSGPSRTDSGAC